MEEFKTKLSIDGKFVEYYEAITLKQSIHNHHEFKVELDYQVIEKMGTHTMEASKEWLGKNLVIIFDEYAFLGVITDMELVHSGGFNSRLHLTGYSKTIVLESGEHLQSWIDKDLSSIVKEVARDAGVPAKIKPVFTDKISYECQYEESHYTFLQRLAKQYNEWLYFDGNNLVFGKPLENKDPIHLEYGKELLTIQISMKTAPTKFGTFSYNYEDDKKYIDKAKGKVQGLNELGSHAFRTSKDLFKLEVNKHYKGVFNDKSKIDGVLKAQQAAAVAKANTIQATSSKQGLSVGTVIKLTSARYKDDKSFEVKPYGQYIITEIEHEAGKDSYSNKFTAIPAGITVLPFPKEIAEPMAEPQLAIVLSNKDPQNKGRVQVQFQWQVDGMKTNWIPVMSPDAGKSDLVGKNRGFVFIPEKGDQVMIGFRYNSPNRPFVMGGMFGGKTAGGGNQDNKLKSITTRSGSTIVFDDKGGKGKITISDPSGNVVTLNGDETITISAPKSVTINSEEIMLNASKSVTVNGEEQVLVNSKQTAVIGKDEVAIQSDTQISAEAESVSINGKSTLSAEGAIINVDGKTMTNVKGTILNLN